MKKNTLQNIKNLKWQKNNTTTTASPRCRRVLRFEEITIKCVQSVKRRDIALLFHQGQNAALKRRKLDGLSSSAPDFLKDANSHLIVALDKDGVMVGGLQVYEMNKQHLAPMQKALNMKLTDNPLLVPSRRSAEFCSLWSSAVITGGSLTALMIQQAMLYACSIGIDQLHAFSSPHIFKTAVAEGWQIDYRFGDRGKMAYPTPKYISTVIKFPQLAMLAGSDIYQRTEIVPYDEAV